MIQRALIVRNSNSGEKAYLNPKLKLRRQQQTCQQRRDFFQMGIQFINTQLL